jgi:hypothetical protein
MATCSNEKSGADMVTRGACFEALRKAKHLSMRG